MVINYLSELYRQYDSSDEKEMAYAIKNLLGFHPRNLDLYKLAFRHKSVAEEVTTKFKKSNERLEYLGDAILGAATAHYLFLKYPFKDEGFLTEMRSKIVNRKSLNKLSQKMGLDKFIEVEGNLSTYTSALGDCFEALMGAVYLDQGFEMTKNVIIDRIIKIHFDLDTLVDQDLNIKNKIIQWAQKNKINFLIDFEEITNSSTKYFKCKIKIDDETKAEGKASSKKNAELIALENFLNLYDDLIN